MRTEMRWAHHVRSTIVILAGALLLSLCSLISGAAAKTASVEQAVNINLSALDALPPANATNVRCHVLPAKLPGQSGSGANTYPGCDARSGMNLAPAPFANGCQGGCGAVNYNGGPVVTSAQSTHIYLNCASSCWGNPFQFLSDFYASSFVHVLDQYMEPSVLQASGRYTVNQSSISLNLTTPHTLSDSQLQTIILNAIKQQFPSGGGGGYDKMYAIFLPQHQDLCLTQGSFTFCYCPDQDSSCRALPSGFCAYHESFDSTDAVGNPIHVIYQAMPYAEDCFKNVGPNGAVADSQNYVYSHEISETISDPDGTAWGRNSDGSEIGDICTFPGQNPIYLNSRPYDIQTEYSNAAQGCVGLFPLLADSHNFDGIEPHTITCIPFRPCQLNVNFNSDILWRNDSTGQLTIWSMNGAQILSQPMIGTVTGAWSLVGIRDFNGDGYADILWSDPRGNLGIWLMNGGQILSTVSLGELQEAWSVVGTGDFNGDGVGDILLRNASSGQVKIWLMSNGQVSSTIDLDRVPPVLQVMGTGDFNGDGTTDILFRNTQTGDFTIWLMSKGQVSSTIDLGQLPLNWTVAGTGDFDGDGVSDIVLRDTAGDVAIWFTGDENAAPVLLPNMSPVWSVAQTGDYNGDGKSDILWTDSSGNVLIWFMDGASISSTSTYGNVGTNLKVQSLNSD